MFKIVPMLNPDGVIHGNYRCSIAGTDLNRRYQDRHPVLHPEVKAITELVAHLQVTRGVFLYLDLHGHSQKKNAFAYGCDVSLQPDKWVKCESKRSVSDIQSSKVFSRVFPKILSSVSNCRQGGYFSFRDCSFKVQRSKAGTGRVMFWKSIGIQAAYTIELSFCGNGNNEEARLLKRKKRSTKSCSQSSVSTPADDDDEEDDADDELDTEGNGSGIFDCIGDKSSGKLGVKRQLQYNDEDEYKKLIEVKPHPQATRTQPYISNHPGPVQSTPVNCRLNLTQPNPTQLTQLEPCFSPNTDSILI